MKAWEAIHMMPEQSVQAGIDVKGKLLMPIHWGGFELSVHTWTEPIIRFKEENERLGQKWYTLILVSALNLVKIIPPKNGGLGLNEPKHSY